MHIVYMKCVCLTLKIVFLDSNLKILSKMKKLRTHFSFSLLVSILFLSSFSFSQENNWKQLYDDQGIKVEYQKLACDQPKQGINMEEVYLKFTNTTEKNIFVDWQYDVTYGDKCYNCEGGLAEMSQTLKLAPNASIEATCGDDNYYRLRIFSKFLNIENVSELTNFHVKNIVVREIKDEE